MTEIKPKKPIALAITLIILVLCIMLNIVFVSKNIGLKQETQVKTGKEIVRLLSNINQQSLFIQTHLTNGNEELKQLAERDTSLGLVANEIMKHELSSLETDLQSLFAVTTAIKQEGFSQSALEGKATRLAQTIQKLEQVSYVKDVDLLQQIEQLVSTVYETSQQFNYKLVDSKTAMIRMSNGFEWDKTVQDLDKALNID